MWTLQARSKGKRTGEGGREGKRKRVGGRVRRVKGEERGGEGIEAMFKICVLLRKDNCEELQAIGPIHHPTNDDINPSPYITLKHALLFNSQGRTSVPHRFSPPLHHNQLQALGWQDNPANK